MRFRLFLVGLGLVATLSAVSLPAATLPPLLLVFDASGSMWGKVGGEEKIVAARRIVGQLVDGLAQGSSVGLVAYGHRREGDCADIETVVPIGALDRAAFKKTFTALQPKGKTPITASLEVAFSALAASKQAGTLVLVTDGLETCGGDPCAAVKKARARGLDLVLHVVGFDVAKEDVSSLECAAQAGGGLYLPAADAKELAAALSAATALPAGASPGTLSVKALSEKGLEDVLVTVRKKGEREDLTHSRTYRDAATNPRLFPLPPGDYEVEVRAHGMKGDNERRFVVTIADGKLVEKVLDFSTGELAIGVTRNGVLSDANYTVRVPAAKATVATGRTYHDAQHNPAKVRLTAGTYEVEIRSVEIAGREPVSLGTVVVEPGGKVAVARDLPSGTLRIGVRKGSELVDAVVAVKRGKTSVDQSRTYKASTSNPKEFIVPPGEYQVEVSVIGGEKHQLAVTVAAGETVEKILDLAVGGS